MSIVNVHVKYEKLSLFLSLSLYIYIFLFLHIRCFSSNTSFPFHYFCAYVFLIPFYSSMQCHSLIISYVCRYLPKLYLYLAFFYLTLLNYLYIYLSLSFWSYLSHSKIFRYLDTSLYIKFSLSSFFLT